MIIGGEVIACALLKFGNASLPCLFKLAFHVPCPGCGMTRAFREITDLHMINAFRYNILSLPLLVFLLAISLAMIVDLIKNTDHTGRIITGLANHPAPVFLLLAISEVVNIYKAL